MTDLYSTCKRLRLDHLAWIHAKLALMFWALMYIWHPIPVRLDELGVFLNVTMAGFVFVGAGISVGGLIYSVKPATNARRQGYAFELFGLTIAMVGLLSYFLAIFMLKSEPVRFTQGAYSYAMFTLLGARMTVVRRAWQRGT